MTSQLLSPLALLAIAGFVILAAIIVIIWRREARKPVDEFTGECVTGLPDPEAPASPEDLARGVG